MSRTPHRWIVLAMALAAVVYASDLRRSLPYAPEVDEDAFVAPAARMAASGSLNPGWFGHPGSTVIYPLAATFKLASAFTTVDLSQVGGAYHLSHSAYFLIGRVINCSFALLLIPVVFALGARAFGPGLGLLAACVSCLPVMWLGFVTRTRTDTASTFFATLAMALTVRYATSGRTRDQILAAVSLGLAVSSKYSMVFFLPALCVMDLCRGRAGAVDGERASVWLRMLRTIAVTGAAFVSTTPYLLLDPRTAWWSVQQETAFHFGADGLSPLQNLVYYVADGIPSSLGRRLAWLALIGAAWIVYRGSFVQRWLVGTALVYVVATSALPLHWARWMVQIFPLLALFASYAIVRLGAVVAARLRVRAVWVQLAIGGWTLAGPGTLFIGSVATHTVSTPVEAREWMLRNVPPGSRVGSDAFTAALADTPYDVTTRWRLAETPLSYFEDHHFDVLVLNDANRERLQGEHDRYPDQLRFYADLERRGTLVATFAPPHGGMVALRIYTLH
jgi:hypothetical protein